MAFEQLGPGTLRSDTSLTTEGTATEWRQSKIYRLAVPVFIKIKIWSIYNVFAQGQKRQNAFFDVHCHCYCRSFVSRSLLLRRRQWERHCGMHLAAFIDIAWINFSNVALLRSKKGNTLFDSYRWKGRWSWPCFDTTLSALLCKSFCSYANWHFLSIICTRKGKRSVSKQGPPQPHVLSKAGILSSQL